MNHEKHLKNLLRKTIVETPANHNFSRRVEITIPRKLEKTLDDDVSGNNVLTLTNGEVISYYHSLEELRKDPKTEYLKYNEIRDKLDFLIWEVWLNVNERKNEIFRKTKIEIFLKAICKSLEEYEIVFKINNLKIKKKNMFWDFLIGSFSKEALIEKGFDESENGIYKISDFENKTLIFVREVGNNSSLVTERAKKKANFAVKLLQSYLSEMNFVRNEQLLFSLSIDYAIRKTSNMKAMGGWKRDFSPLPFDYEEIFTDFTNKANNHYEIIISLNPKIRNAIEKAYYWIGKSIAELDFDMKITLLFTALESLLTTIADGSKGERIAYRVALLNTSFDTPYTHPSDILQIYKMRSGIIHGSEVDIASKSEYYKLMQIVRQVLDFYIKFAKTMFQKPLDIINLLIESKESEKLQKWLESFPDKNSQEVAKCLLTDIEIDRNKS